MVIFNKNDHEVKLDGSRFSEMIGASDTGREVMTGEVKKLDIIGLPARSSLILEL